MNKSNAVNVRQELDLRLGCAFTRYLTLSLQRKFQNLLNKCLISFGPCQFPTLGFVVERYKEIERFVAEKFWKIAVEYKQTSFLWERGHLHSQSIVKAIHKRLKANNE